MGCCEVRVLTLVYVSYEQDQKIWFPNENGEVVPHNSISVAQSH